MELAFHMHFPLGFMSSSRLDGGKGHNRVCDIVKMCFPLYCSIQSQEEICLKSLDNEVYVRFFM